MEHHHHKSRDREGRSRSRERDRKHSHRERDNKRSRDDSRERRHGNHDDRGGKDNYHRDRNRERESMYGPGANTETAANNQRRDHKQQIIEPTRIVVLKNLPTLTTESLVSVHAFLSLRRNIFILFIKPRICLHLLAGS